jgi:hypothetical protein
MPPDQIAEAARNFTDADPVLGSVIAVLMLVIGFLVHWLRSCLGDVAAANKAHLEDVRKFAAENVAMRQIVDTNSEQTRAAAETMRTMIEVIREKVRS